MEDVNIWLEWKEMWDIAPLLVSNVYFFFQAVKKRWALTLSLSRKLNLIGDQLTVICILPTGNVASCAFFCTCNLQSKARFVMLCWLRPEGQFSFYCDYPEDERDFLFYSPLEQQLSNSSGRAPLFTFRSLRYTMQTQRRSRNVRLCVLFNLFNM